MYGYRTSVLIANIQEELIAYVQVLCTLNTLAVK